MVYLAQSQSLAALEILVHINDASLLSSYVAIEAVFDDSLVMTLDSGMLPDGWDNYPGPNRLRTIGDTWAQSEYSPILRVPSSVVRREFNYLVNPEHPEFALVRLGNPEDFHFDPRLL